MRNLPLPTQTTRSARPAQSAQPASDPTQTQPSTDPHGSASGEPPRRYHRQFAAQPRNRWFKPILVALLFLVFYGVAMIAEFAGFGIWAAISFGSDADFNAWFDTLVDFNTVTGVLFGLLNVILMWPAVELAVFCIYRRWFASMISLRGGMRWGLLGRYLLIGAGVWVVCAIVMALFSDGAMGNLTSGIVWNRHVVTMLVALILLVPFQAMAEEIAFRGLAMNIVGAWLRHPAWAVLIPVPFFVAGHLYDLPGLIDVGIFAAIVGTLTIITGGLEAGIAFHVVNNLFAFGLGVLAGADLNATSSPTAETVVSIASPFVFAAIVVLDHRRRGGASSRETLRPSGDESECAGITAEENNA
jgi:membrane protease YdiL (CAAX protease family)